MYRIFMYLPINTKQINLLNVAYKMLINSRKKFIGMIIGATFAAFTIMQQPGIQQGISDRLVADITAVPEVDLWVMAYGSRDFDNPTSFVPIDSYRIRSVPGVLSATHLYRFKYGFFHSKTSNDQSWILVGVDPDNLLGLPKNLLAGSLDNIHDLKAIIVDGYALRQLRTENNTTINMGDTLAQGQTQFIVAGITKPLRTWMTSPKAYILSNHFRDIKNKTSFIIVKIKKTANVHMVAEMIHASTGYDALTPSEFIDRSLDHFEKTTPIMIIFLCIAAFGFFIGLIIMWQIFSNFILTHLHQFGMLKMLGVSNSLLRNMVLFQAFCTGGIGYLIGLCLVILFGVFFNDSDIAFTLTWKIVLLGALGTTVIIILSSFFSINKLLRMDSIDLCRDNN